MHWRQSSGNWMWTESVFIRSYPRILAREEADMVNISRTIMTWFSVRQRPNPWSLPRTGRQRKQFLWMHQEVEELRKLRHEPHITDHSSPPPPQALCFKPRSNNRETSGIQCDLSQEWGVNTDQEDLFMTPVQWVHLISSIVLLFYFPWVWGKETRLRYE